MPPVNSMSSSSKIGGTIAKAPSISPLNFWRELFIADKNFTFRSRASFLFRSRRGTLCLARQHPRTNQGSGTSRKRIAGFCAILKPETLGGAAGR